MRINPWGKSDEQKFLELYEKLNPAQSEIVLDQGEHHDSNQSAALTNHRAYEEIEVVTRGVNLIVDSASEIFLDITERLKGETITNPLRPTKLGTLLNFTANPFISAEVMRRNVFMDLVLEGNAFLYFDGAYLYNLPAVHMEIIADEKTFIKEYKYNKQSFSPDTIIHIRENSASSIYRGTSRLNSAKSSIKTLYELSKFQSNFFENSCIIGVVLKSKNILSKKIKDRILAEWRVRFRPRSGGKSPLILDGDFDIETLDKTIKDIDFSDTVKSNEHKILKALGVPIVLLDGGNNANISPNLRLFYITTVMPLVLKYTTALEQFFGYDMKPAVEDILALRPDLKELQGYLTGLTNAGIITRNEARAEIRYEARKEDFADQLIIPANVAGSNINPSEGGRPPNDEEEEENDE